MFSFQGLGVQVECPDGPELVWLEEFLAPHFDVTSAGHFSCRIVVERNTEEYEALLSRGPTGEETEAFVFDSRVEKLPVWASESGDSVVFDEGFRTFYLVDRRRERVTVLGPDDNGVRGRTPLMRVVRELAMTQARIVGGHLIHASAFSSGDKAAVVTGHKGAGKTTLLLYMVTQGRMGLLSNDRVLAAREDDEYVLRGIPTIATVLPSTFDLMPDLGWRLLDGGFHYELHAGEAEARKVHPLVQGGNGKWSFSPREFSSRLGTRDATRVKPAILVFPEVTGVSGTVSIEAIDCGEAEHALRPTLFGGTDAARVTEVFLPPGEHADAVGDTATQEDDLDRFCREFTRTVPSYRFRLGTDAYKDGEAADRLAALLENAP